MAIARRGPGGGRDGDFMIGLRGFAGVDVGALGQAQFEGEINPSWLAPPMVTSGPDPNPQPLPAWLYPTQGFASQVAGLLGGSVAFAPPAYNFGTITVNGQETTTLPNAYQVSVDGQLVMPGNIWQPGSLLDFTDECDAEQYFAASIPGGQLSATCAAGGPGETTSQLAVQKGDSIPALPSGESTIVGYTPPGTITVPGSTCPTGYSYLSGVYGGPSQCQLNQGTPAATSTMVPAVASVVPVASPTPLTPVSLPAAAQSSGSQVIAANPPAAAGATPPVNPPAAGSQITATNTSGCFNPISSLLSMDSCLGPLGIIEWAALAGLALLLFSYGGKH